jgi:hypothetical protein
MSRFAVLGEQDDDDGSDVEPEIRRYSFQEIINLERSSRDRAPPPNLATFPAIFLSEWQPIECSSFHPPSRDVNSQSVPESKPSRRSPARSPQRSAPAPAAPPHPKPAVECPEPIDFGQCWEYRDPMDTIMGPFPAQRMQEWLEKKAIDASLFVRRAGSDEKFQQISSIFPDLALAFLEPSAARGTEEPQRTTLVVFEVSDDELSWDIEESK